MYKNIFFDLDGTLTDPGVGITNSVAYALKKLGIDVHSRESLYKFIGPPLRVSFEEFYGFDDNKSELGVKYYREYYTDKGIFENEVYPNIPDLLEALKNNGRTIILATSKPEIFAERILEHFNLSRYFDCICGSSLDKTRTTKSDVISYALKTADITSTESCIMIGDREHDIFGAKANNLRSVGVLYGYGSEDELRTAGADYIVSSVDKIKNFLLKEI